MPTLTFNQSGNTVSIQGKVTYKSQYYDERYGQSFSETCEGTIVATDNNGINIRFGLLLITDVDYTEGEALRTWLRTYAVYKQNSFSITSDNAQSDLGAGKGNPVTSVNFIQSDDKNVFKHKAPGRYNIKFPYSYLVS